MPNNAYNFIAARSQKKYINYWAPKFNELLEFDESSWPTKKRNGLFQVTGLIGTGHIINGYTVKNGDWAVFNQDEVLIDILGGSGSSTLAEGFDGVIVTNPWTPTVNSGQPYLFTTADNANILGGGTVAQVTNKVASLTTENFNLVDGQFNTFVFGISDPSSYNEDNYLYVKFNTAHDAKVMNSESAVGDISYPSVLSLKIEYRDSIGKLVILGFGLSEDIGNINYTGFLSNEVVVDWSTDLEFGVSILPEEGKVGVVRLEVKGSNFDYSSGDFIVSDYLPENVYLDSIKNVSFDCFQYGTNDHQTNVIQSASLTSTGLVLYFPPVIENSWGYSLYIRKDANGISGFPSDRNGKVYQLTSCSSIVKHNGSYFYNEDFIMFTIGGNIAGLIGGENSIDADGNNSPIFISTDIRKDLVGFQPGLEYIISSSSFNSSQIESNISYISEDTSRKKRIATVRNDVCEVYSEILPSLNNHDGLMSSIAFALPDPATLAYDGYIEVGYASNECKYLVRILATNNNYYCIGYHVINVKGVSTFYSLPTPELLNWTTYEIYKVGYSVGIIEGVLTALNFSTYDILTEIQGTVVAGHAFGTDTDFTPPNRWYLKFTAADITVDSYPTVTITPNINSIPALEANPFIITLIKNIGVNFESERSLVLNKGGIDYNFLPLNIPNKMIYVSGVEYDNIVDPLLGNIKKGDVILTDSNSIPVSIIRTTDSKVVNTPIIQPMVQSPTTPEWRKFWLLNENSPLPTYWNSRDIVTADVLDISLNMNEYDATPSATLLGNSDLDYIFSYPIQQLNEDFYISWQTDVTIVNIDANAGNTNNFEVDIGFDICVDGLWVLAGIEHFAHFIAGEWVNTIRLYNSTFETNLGLETLVDDIGSGPTTGMLTPQFTLGISTRGTYRLWINGIPVNFATAGILPQYLLNDYEMIRGMELPKNRAISINNWSWIYSGLNHHVTFAMEDTVAEAAGYKRLNPVTTNSVALTETLDVKQIDIPSDHPIRLPQQRYIDGVLYPANTWLIKDGDTVHQLLTEDEWKTKPLMYAEKPNTPLIHFRQNTTFWHRGDPCTDNNIVLDTDGSVPGVIQKIYHKANVEPTISQARFIGSNDYDTSLNLSDPNVSNIIYIECGIDFNGTKTYEYWYSK